MGTKLNDRAKRIVELCKQAREKFEPEEDGTTYCNLAVNWVARGMGHDDLAGLLANQQIKLFNESGDWAKVTPEDAKKLADDGNVVVAGRKGQPHGHVAVVMPGYPMAPSGKWGGEWPSVSNVGKRNWICGSSFAFIYKPDYYVLVQDREAV